MPGAQLAQPDPGQGQCVVLLVGQVLEQRSGFLTDRLTKTKPSQVSTCTGHNEVVSRSISSFSIIGVVTSRPSSA